MGKVSTDQCWLLVPVASQPTGFVFCARPAVDWVNASKGAHRGDPLTGDALTADTAGRKQENTQPAADFLLELVERD
jgi:hypothetical protein